MIEKSQRETPDGVYTEVLSAHFTYEDENRLIRTNAWVNEDDTLRCEDVFANHLISFLDAVRGEGQWYETAARLVQYLWEYEHGKNIDDREVAGALLTFADAAQRFIELCEEKCAAMLAAEESVA